MAAKKKGQVDKGRPSVLTPETQASICAALAIGCYIEAAAAFAGVSPRSLHYWLAAGKKGEQPYADFLQAVEQAKGKKTLTYLSRVSEASKGDWRAATWVLERTDPEHFGGLPASDEKGQERGYLLIPVKVK